MDKHSPHKPKSISAKENCSQKDTHTHKLRLAGDKSLKIVTVKLIDALQKRKLT